MRITLIQTAGNRRNELIRFISTLHLQLHDASFDIEYIFVDQADNRDLFVDIEKRLHFVYIKTDKCSLSHARNLAIPKITGDIVSFPDDDCWYPKNLLKKVIDVFMDNIYDGVTGVVTNENGIKYNVDDGWVRVTLDADHKYFYVKVADSGMGIPEESIGRIFERFYRVDKSHSKEIGGTGLGLAITRSAVTMHHGTIQVASKEGEGTTFTVRIPLSYIP